MVDAAMIDGCVLEKLAFSLYVNSASVPLSLCHYNVSTLYFGKQKSRVNRTFSAVVSISISEVAMVMVGGACVRSGHAGTPKNPVYVCKLRGGWLVGRSVGRSAAALTGCW